MRRHVSISWWQWAVGAFGGAVGTIGFLWAAWIIVMALGGEP